MPPSHRTFRRHALGVLVLVVSCAGRAAAQQQLPISEILPQLIGNTIVLLPGDLADQPNHRAHFKPGPDQLEVPGQFNQALLTLLSTYPVGSPSGGFTYIFDPALGTFTRASESFGPFFAERALTIGRTKVSVGLGHQRATYDTFEGLNLRQRDLKFFVRHIDCCSRAGGSASQPDNSLLTPAFEGDLVETALALDLVTDTTVLSVNYGVHDRLDIGVAIPFVRVRMDASVVASIERLATAAEPTTHRFEGPDPDQQTFRASGQASGLGDVVLRAKYLVLPVTGGGLAGAVDVRVPTGDETNLLGTGGVQGRAYAIASFTHGRVSPHLNLGYTFSSRGALPRTRLRDEINGALGFDLVMTPRATLAVDVLSRILLDAGRLRQADKIFEFIPAGTGSGGGGGGGGGGGQPAPSVAQTVTRQELQLEPGNLRLFLGSAGIRFSPWRSVLVTAGFLFPLTEAGLRDRVTPVIGLDYGF